MNLEAIEADVYEKASVNRDHILEFLKLQNTNDGVALKSSLEAWLNKIHDDPKFTKVQFNPEGDTSTLGVSSHPIHRILSDLESYGYPRRETLLDTAND